MHSAVTTLQIGRGSMKLSYRTVAGKASQEMIERKSRFISHVRPAASEEQALAFIEEIRTKHYDATHNVYAYVLGEQSFCRFSDDGEPSGTAGIPVLEVIKKERLIDVAVVVTRYFGGILLGGGGLRRAYGASAKRGIDAAGIITRILCDIVQVSADYTLFGKIQYETHQAGFHIRHIDYAGDVCLSVYTPVEQTQTYLKLVTELTNARAVCRIIGQEYQDLDA